MKKSWILIVVLVLVIISTLTCIFVANTSILEPLPVSSTDVLYEYTESNVNRTFTNYYGGYTYTFDYSLTPNTDFISKRVRFENENATIDIFNETDNNVDSYINYTNKAIKENKRLTITEEKTLNYNSETVKKITWKRDKLARIKNDKNYYIKYDIAKDNQTYTILIKSNEPIEDDKYLQNFQFSTKVNFTEDFVRGLDKKLTSNINNKNLNEETRKFYQEYFVDSNKLNWGVFSPAFSNNKPDLAEYEEKINYQFPFILHYTAIESAYDKTKVENLLNRAYAENKYVELTLQHPLGHNSEQFLFDVLNGDYDSFLTDYANSVKDFGHPVLLRLFNEMNGDWCDYSSYRMSADTDLYIELYKYVYSFFEDGENIITVWNPNGKSFPNFDWNADVLHYPGANYVDVIGLTMYNTGNFYEGENWNTFNELYQNLYKEMLERTDLPLMITEFASSRIGGNKEEWVKDMFKQLPNYDRIKVAIWWNHADYTADGEVARPYFIDDSEEMIKIFKDNLN